MVHEQNQYQPLKDIEQKINLVLDKLGIQADESVKDAARRKNNFYMVRTKYQNEDTVFKARLARHTDLGNFQVERFFLKSLTKYKGCSSLVDRVPHLIATKVPREEWMMYRYLPGEVLGIDNSKYDNPKKEEIFKIIELLQNIQSFPLEDFCQSHAWTEKIPRWDASFYLRYFSSRIKNKEAEISLFLDSALLDKAKSILRDKGKVLDRNCGVLVHGDFHPANIIMGNVAGAIDWEKMHIGNSAYDVTTLWFRMLNNLELRKLLIHEFSKVCPQKNDYAELFRLNVLAQMPKEIAKWTDRINNYPADNFYHQEAQKHAKICRENFLSALRGDALEKYI